MSSVDRQHFSVKLALRGVLWCVLLFATASCIHPKVGIRKSRLVDPMMDPAIATNFGETMISTVQSQFEKAVVGGGGAGGGSCPTCK